MSLAAHLLRVCGSRADGRRSKPATRAALVNGPAFVDAIGMPKLAASKVPKEVRQFSVAVLIEEADHGIPLASAALANDGERR